MIFAFLGCSEPEIKIQYKGQVIMTTKRGSWLSEIWFRKELASYAKKIKASTITYKEAIEYISKGGNIDQFQTYDRMKDFFVGAPEYSILVSFIADKNNPDIVKNKDRLNILKLFLSAGSSPIFKYNYKTSDLDHVYSTPMFQAADNDDLEALKLLIFYSDMLELPQDSDKEIKARALSLAQKIDTLDLLSEKGAKLNYIDEEGHNLLHLVVKNQQNIKKLQWLLSKSFSKNVKNSYNETALDMAKRFKLAWEEKRDSNAKDIDRELVELERDILESDWTPHGLTQEQVIEKAKLAVAQKKKEYVENDKRYKKQIALFDAYSALLN